MGDRARRRFGRLWRGISNVSTVWFLKSVLVGLASIGALRVLSGFLGGSVGFLSDLDWGWYALVGGGASLITLDRLSAQAPSVSGSAAEEDRSLLIALRSRVETLEGQRPKPDNAERPKRTVIDALTTFALLTLTFQ